MSTNDKAQPFRDFASDISERVKKMGAHVKLVVSHTAPFFKDEKFNVCINKLENEFALKKSLTDNEFSELESNLNKISAKFSENGFKDIEYCFLYQGNLSQADHESLEITAGKNLEIIYRSMLESMSDEMNIVSLSSRDLGSFVHKCLDNVLPKYIDFEAGSVFLWDELSQSLKLAATTGLKPKLVGKTFNTPKKSDVKYYLHESSYTSICYKHKEIIPEYDEDGNLQHNTFGEDVGAIFNRYYFPIQLRDAVIKTRKNNDEYKQAISSTIGTLRITNVLNFREENILSKINFCILKHFCEKLTVIGTRYLASIRLSHELEQAFHGYTTDMAALSLRIQAIDLLNEKISNIADYEANDISVLPQRLDNDIVENKEFDTYLKNLSRKLRSIQHDTVHQQRAIKDAMTVHDGMGYQLEMVKLHHERRIQNGYEVCELPYKQVFIRVDSSIKDMIEQYHGPEAKKSNLQWQKKGNVDSVQRIPPLLVSEESLYLAARNLVENSIKYTPIGNDVSIKLSWVSDGEHVQFFFEDTGMGIDQEDEGKIFQEGWRSKAARLQGLRGTGMGLAVCQAALKSEGAILRYVGTGENGSGAIFEIKVRIAREVDIYSG